MSAKDPYDLIPTVRRFRAALGCTQQEFAESLGVSIATAVRYEHTRVPGILALNRLMQAAERRGLGEFAKIFRTAMTEQLNRPLGLVWHRKRHVQLHQALDELCADWASHQPPGKIFSNSTIMELMQWSFEQTQNPTEVAKGKGGH